MEKNNSSTSFTLKYRAILTDLKKVMIFLSMENNVLNCCILMIYIYDLFIQLVILPYIKCAQAVQF